MLSTSGAQAGPGLDHTGGLEARQGVATQDWGSPYTALKQNSKPEFHLTPSSELRAGAQHMFESALPTASELLGRPRVLYSARARGSKQRH